MPPKPRDTGGAAKVYCSERCSKRAKERRRYSRQVPVPPVTVVTTCAECGLLTARRSPYCSIRCRNRRKCREYQQRRREREGRPPASAPLPLRACAWCTTSYQPVHTAQRYCGVRCRKAADWQRQQARDPIAVHVLVGALVNRRPRVVRAAVVLSTRGLWVYCPCGGMAGVPPLAEGFDLYRRRCACGAVVLVNAEEADWLITTHTP